ncbi:rna-directed dna polymerase from mobile element jockey-like [Willisornis vidua]|uniref:Rna-directed dna polymerase from mobile element jockey-like n=1 Tax=Willisornis vidua TaxID=1566151 RepID=A0ABQ9CM38_9PASS|nr:rna-directed dna polymerase from mobile element jockey-like [Willisornis vidua]
MLRKPLLVTDSSMVYLPVFQTHVASEAENWFLILKIQSPGLGSYEVLQGSILGPVLFNIFINHWNTGLEEILSKFADDKKMGGIVDFFEGREALQSDLYKLEDWAITNHVKFNEGKCGILYLGLGNPGCTYRLGNEMLESSAMGRDLGMLVDGKLNDSAVPWQPGGPTMS